MGRNIHGPGDWEEILLVEKTALEDEGVKAEIAKLGLPEGTAVISDPWIYGILFRNIGVVGEAHFPRIRRCQRRPSNVPMLFVHAGSQRHVKLGLESLCVPSRYLSRRGLCRPQSHSH